MASKEDDMPGFVSPDRSSRMSAFDLYEDLLVKDSDKESLVSIHEVNQEREVLKDENKRLMEELKALHEKNAKLSLEKKSIQSSFDQLLETAKVEIKRKNNLITTIKERPHNSGRNRKVTPIHSKKKRLPTANIERQSKPQRASLKGMRIDDDPVWRKKFMKNSDRQQEIENLEVEKMIKEKRKEEEENKTGTRSNVKLSVEMKTCNVITSCESADQQQEQEKKEEITNISQRRIKTNSNVDDGNSVAKERISRGIVSNKNPDKQPRVLKSSVPLKDTAVKKTDKTGNAPLIQNISANHDKIKSPLKRKTLANIVRRSPIKFPGSKNNKPLVNMKRIESASTKKSAECEVAISTPTATNKTVTNPPSTVKKIAKKPDEIVAEKLNMAFKQMAKSDTQIDCNHDFVTKNSNFDLPKNIGKSVTNEYQNQKVIEKSKDETHLEQIKHKDQKKTDVTTSTLDKDMKVTSEISPKTAVGLPDVTSAFHDDIKISPKKFVTKLSEISDEIQKKVDSPSITASLSGKSNENKNDEELELKKIEEHIEKAVSVKNTEASIDSRPASVEINIDEDQEDHLGMQQEEDDDLEEGEICSSSDEDVPQKNEEKISRRSLLFKQDRNRSLEEKSNEKMCSEKDKRRQMKEKPKNDLKLKNKPTSNRNRQRSTSRTLHSVDKRTSHERERNSYRREGKDKKHIDDRRRERCKEYIDPRSIRSSKEREHERISSDRKHLDRRRTDLKRDERRESRNRHDDQTKESLRRKGSSQENDRLDRMRSRNTFQHKISPRLRKIDGKSKYDEKHRHQQSNIGPDSKREKLTLQKSRSKNDSSASRRPSVPEGKLTNRNIKQQKRKGIIDKSSSFNEVRNDPEDFDHNPSAVDVLDLGLDTWFDFNEEPHLASSKSPPKKPRQEDLTKREAIVRRSPRKHKSSKPSPLHKTVLTKHLTPDKNPKKVVTSDNKIEIGSNKKPPFPKRLQLKLHDLKDKLHVSDFNVLCTNKSMSVKDDYNSNCDDPERKKQIPLIKSPLSLSSLNSPHHLPAESPCSSVALEIDEGLDYDEDSLMATPIFSEKSPRNDTEKKEKRLEDGSKEEKDGASRQLDLKSKRKASQDLSCIEHTKKPKVSSPVFKGIIKKVSKLDKPCAGHEDGATKKNKDSIPKITKTKSTKKKKKLPVKKSPKKNLTVSKSRTPKIRLNKAGLLTKNKKKKSFRVLSSSNEEDDIDLECSVSENIKTSEVPQRITSVTPVKAKNNSVTSKVITQSQSSLSNNVSDSTTIFKNSLEPILPQSGIVGEDTPSSQPKKDTLPQEALLSEEVMDNVSSDLDTIDETYSSDSCDSLDESQSYNISMNNYHNAALQLLLSLAHRTLANYRRDNKIPTTPPKKEPRRVSTEWVSEVPRSERSSKNPERFLSPPSNHRSVWLRSLEEADKRRKLRNRWSSETHSETDTSVAAMPSTEQDISSSAVTMTSHQEQPPPLAVINEESRLASDVASSASVLSLSDLTMTEESRCNLLSMMNVVKPLTPIKVTPPRLRKIYNTPPEVNAKKRKKVRKKLQSSMS